MVPKFLHVNFCYLLVYLSCKPNQRSILFVYLFHLLVQGCRDPLYVFSEVFVAEGVDGVGGKGSGDTTIADVATLLEAC